MSTTIDDDPVVQDGSCYLPFDNLLLAVKVARTINRPLLLYGQPGSGKSTLAKYVAYTEDLRYYEHVTTSRTQARDLLWTFDAVRRLGDAQVDGGLKEDHHYVAPGTLWWAFDRGSALEHGPEPFGEWNDGHAGQGAVVLVDEIDKADPDLPNGLLVPLSARRFTVTDIAGGPQVRETERNLIVITSNRERDLPAAFERRCVVYEIPMHGAKQLRQITKAHLDRMDKQVPAGLIDRLVGEFEKARANADRDGRRQPSTAEFLDAVTACATLDPADAPAILAMIFTKDVHG
jgi:MoxR-like ATPase